MAPPKSTTKKAQQAKKAALASVTLVKKKARTTAHFYKPKTLRLPRTPKVCFFDTLRIYIDSVFLYFVFYCRFSAIYFLALSLVSAIRVDLNLLIYISTRLESLPISKYSILLQTVISTLVAQSPSRLA